MTTKADFFTPEREIPGSTKTHLSPSGNYKLVISKFETTKNGWDYSQGKLYRMDQDDPVAVVQRNYSSFPFLFVENHPKGDFLVCGENYQGQTIVEGRSGERKDYTSEGANVGGGFCWAEYKYDKQSQIMMVNGCVWACPYEIRFYDFSDPLNGIPELKIDCCIDSNDIDVDDDEKHLELSAKYEWPEIDGNLIKCHQLYDNELAYTIMLERRNNELKTIDEWVSDAEKERRQQREEAAEKYQKWLDEFKTNSPLYLTMLDYLSKPEFKSASKYDSVGYTYKGWCPDETVNEKRWCRRICSDANGYTIDLEFGVEKGPVKLVIFKDKNKSEDKFFEHSVEGMKSALEYAEHLITNGPIISLLGKVLNYLS